MRQNELFIGGKWATASTDRRIEVISPHTELPVARVAAAGPDDVDAAVEAARAAFDAGPWPRLRARRTHRRRTQARQGLR